MHADQILALENSENKNTFQTIIDNASQCWFNLTVPVNNAHGRCNFEITTILISLETKQTDDTLYCSCLFEIFCKRSQLRDYCFSALNSAFAKPEFIGNYSLNKDKTTTLQIRYHLNHSTNRLPESLPFEKILTLLGTSFFLPVDIQLIQPTQEQLEIFAKYYKKKENPSSYSVLFEKARRNSNGSRPSSPAGSRHSSERPSPIGSPH